MKKCTHCKLPQAMTEFYQNPKSGLWASWCNSCSRTNRREAYRKIGRPFGERNGKSKFTDEQRVGIAQSHLSPTRLARIHGVHRCTIQRIRRLVKTA